jgi:hypothetical protein
VRLVVAPDRSPWVEPLLETLGPEVKLLTPWSLPWRVVGRLARLQPNAIAARLTLRKGFDRLVAQWLKFSPRFDEVYAPSLGARHVFAATTAKCVLIDDLPGLRELHRDLDLAALALPRCSFLRNHRAAASFVIAQEQERVLATRALTTGHLGCRRLVASGLRRENISALPMTRALRSLTFAPDSNTVLVAGAAASRYGLEVALKALPGCELVAAKGDGAHQPSLQRVRLVDAGQPLSVAAVIAPAWVECTPPEVDAAIAAGIPVVGTARALGWHRAGTTIIAPGDVAALSAAVGAVLPRSQRRSSR